MADLAWFFGIWIAAAFFAGSLVGRRLRRQQPTNRPPNTPGGSR